MKGTLKLDAVGRCVVISRQTREPVRMWAVDAMELLEKGLAVLDSADLDRPAEPQPPPPSKIKVEVAAKPVVDAQDESDVTE